MTGGLQRTALRLSTGAARIGWLRTALLSPAVARPGYAVATTAAWIWGAAIGLAPVTRSERLIVCAGLPGWMFGRGGTTVGGVYLTGANTSAPVLRHEGVHRAQWRRYGLAFIPLYVAAGDDPIHNRFEIEAGLADGGYL